MWIGSSRATDQALFNAIATSNIAAVRIYLALGANVNCSYEGDIRPLHVAATVDVPAVMLNLLQLKADPNVMATDGMTPLMLTAERGTRTCAALLLGHGAEANTADPKFLNTALHVAARTGNHAVFDYLLAHPACDPYQLNVNGDRAVDIAASASIVDSFDRWAASNPKVWP